MKTTDERTSIRKPDKINVFAKNKWEKMKQATLRQTLISTALSSALLFACGTTSAAEPGHLEMPHSKGAFMLEYKYMHMNMEGLQSGTDGVSNTAAFASGEAVVPTKMTMDMHMLMPMYNITKNTSVMLMAGYVSNNMDMEMANGHEMAMDTSGLSDTSASVSHKFADDMLAASFAVSIPTGSIDEEVTMHMPMAMTMAAPYAMQLGSGTYDVTPSLTYLGANFDLRYGAQVSYKLRTGENDNGYTLGNAAEAMAWVRKPVMGVTMDAELSVKKWGAIDGTDPAILQAVMTNKAAATSFPQNYGGTMATVSVGASMPVAMINVGAELNMPVYQDLNGLQMQRKMGAAVSLTAMF